MTRRTRLSAALLGALAVLGAACTDSSSDDGFRPTSTTIATPEPAPATPTEPVDCGNPLASYDPLPTQPAPGAMPAGTHMRTIADRGRLVVGVSADTMLMGARNPFTGAIEGFDIDIVREVSRAIFGDPDRIEYRVITYAQRLPSLEDGSVDVVAHTMTINCERWQRIAFTTEYLRAGQKILVRSDSAATSIDELDGERVCAAEGSTNIEEIERYDNVETVGMVDLTDCLVLFQQGAVEAITGDDTVLAGFVAQDPYAKVIGGNFTEEPYGLGISLEHPELVRFVNRVLEQVRADGTFTRLHERWLGNLGPAPTPPPAVYGRQP